MSSSEREFAGSLRGLAHRGWQAPIRHRSYAFDGLLFVAYISLLYKLNAIGFLALVLMCFLFPLIRKHNWDIAWGAAGFSIAYVAMATVTAVMVNKLGGAARTVQGTITVFAVASMIKYLL